MPPSFLSVQFDALGTHWKISTWGNALSETELAQMAQSTCEEFEAKFSRFRPDSLLSTMRGMHGVVRVPRTMTEMLQFSAVLSERTSGAFNPLIGLALESLGYDASYALKTTAKVASVPPLHEALEILDAEHVRLLLPVTLDFGAIGKGRCIDELANALRSRGVQKFLVDGSGDIVYEGDEPIRCGLEHPDDPKKVIGVFTLRSGSFCASAGNRRRWGKYHHIVNPLTGTSPKHILGTWVAAPRAMEADAIATALFFTPAEQLFGIAEFESLVLYSDYSVSRTQGFGGELFY